MIVDAAKRGSRILHLATTARSATADPRRIVTVVFVALLVTGGAITLWPFVAPLVLSLWAARLSRPLFVRFRQLLGGREGAAGVVTALLVVGALAPLVLAIITLVPAGKSLLEELRTASGGKGIFEALVSRGGGDGAPLEGGGFVSLAKEYGAGASKALAIVAGASLEVIVGTFVFFAVFHSLLVQGERWWGWMRDHTPVEAAVLDRLGFAFHEAGRGLVVGTGLTALIQGGLATVLYAMFGVPRALLLGMLTVFGALIPMTGPMIVWVPVCAGLAFTGQVGKAVGLAALCTGVVGTVDNVVRPWLSRRFEVGMPATVVLVTMLGGVVVFGGWGLFLGPLVVRLAGEMLEVCRERGIFGREASRSLYSKTP